MDRSGRSLSALLLVALVFLPHVVVAKAKDKPRYSPPQNGKGGRIDIEQYYRIDDPKEAARILLEEAKLAQVDIDQRWDGAERNEIRLGSGPMVPDKNDKRFLEKAARQASSSETDTETICVIKCNRVLTIRETADMMNQGIRLYRGAPFFAYFAKVPASAALYLQEFEAVDWVGEFTPEMKYNRRTQFVRDRVNMVYSLAGDRQDLREDLESLGCTVIDSGNHGLMHHRYDFYVVKIDPDRVGDIASLWWVQEIYQTLREQNESIAASETIADSMKTASPTPASGFYPLDSRRLVSWDPNAVFDGYSQEILIYELGCDWNHADLRYQVISNAPGISDSPSSDEHGTLVAGVAVGRLNISVPDGGISGVAKGATFVFRRRITGQHNVVGVDADNGFKISNHSWGLEGDSLGQYTRWAQVFDDFADTKDALIIKSAGNGSNTNPLERITSPGTAKNVLAVGGVYYVPGDSWGERIGKRVEGSVVSSAKGPTVEGMLKPELVAPMGAYSSCADRCVVSTAPRSVAGCRQWALDYSRWYGTSLAAPHVTGAAAIAAQWYEDWYNHQNFQTQQTAGLVSSELLRAFLVNGAIPLRWNGDIWSQGSTYGALPEDTVATEELKGAFANVEYGFGLVNCYSGFNSSDSEYRRVLIWQDEVSFPGSAEKQFFVRLQNDVGTYARPRYLVATMAYDDLPGVTSATNAIIDQLVLNLIDPLGRVYEFRAPSNAYAGTVQKIIVPWPVTAYGGWWTARVNFANTSSSGPFPEQDFAVVVDAMLEAPSLLISGVLSTYTKTPGENFSIPVSVVNTGGNVAAGVTAKIVDSTNQLPFGFETNKTFYLKNLVRGGDKATRSFELRAPFAVGDYTVELEVDAINKMLDGGPYPLRKTITIKVRDKKKVNGTIAMMPGWTTSVKDVDILINGVPSGVRTDVNGDYAVEVEKNFNGVLKPKKGTTFFLPEYQDYSEDPITQDRHDRDHEARWRRVSGRVHDESQQGVNGIIVIPRPVPGSALIASRDTTGVDGSFTVNVEHGWAGKLEPQINSSYATFSVVNPAHAHYDSIISDVYSHNFSTRRAVNWQPGGVHATSTTVEDDYARVAPDGNGGAVVVWTDDRSPATGTDIWVQRVGPDGTPAWSATQVPVCTASGNQETPWIVRFEGNAFLIVWTDLRNGNRDIYAQLIGLDGQALWGQNGVIVCGAVGDQDGLRVVRASDNSAFAVWVDRRSGDQDIFAQRITTSGVSWTVNGLGVCARSGEQGTPSIAPDLNGGAYVAWEDRRPGASDLRDVYVQHISSLGTPAFNVNGLSIPSGSATNCPGAKLPVVAVSEGSGFFVGFLECNEVRVQKVAANGQIMWSPTLRAGTVTRLSISLTGDGSGGAVVAWVGRSNDSCPIVIVQRLNSNGERIWGVDGTGVAALIRSDQPRLMKSDSGSFFVCWRQGINCDSQGPYADVAVQQYDSTGSPMWGRGIVVGGGSGEQGNQTIANDLVSGLLACWTDNRVVSEHRVYVARVNDTPQMFMVSGVVRDQAGAGVENLEVRAVDGSDVLVARMSRSDGTFALGVPAFWRGDIQVVPRGYFNTASPPVQTIGPMLASTVRNFTVSHQSTRWQDEGLGILGDAADVVSPSITTDVSGSLVVVWGTDEQVSSSGDDADVYVQRVDRSGDILWTTGGDRVVSHDTRDELAVALPSIGSDVILLWRRAAEFVSSGGGLWANRFSEPQQGKWGDDGVHLVDDLDVSMFSACSDMAGGAFVCWFDESWTWLTRLRSDGVVDWPSAVKLGYAGVSPPIMEPDSVGGVVLSWQYTGGGQNHLYVQRANSNGQMLWGSGQPGEPLVVRGGFVNMNPGDFRMSVDPFGGALVAWTERSQPISSDDRIRANWIYHDGTKFSGPAGFELPGANDRMLISDLALDDPSHFFVLYRETVPGSAVLRLAVRRVEPDIFGGISDFWSASGRTIATGGIYESRIFGRDPDGGCLVVWRDNYDLNATRLTAAGNPAWSDREHRIASDVFGDVLATSDGARGAYVFWRGLTNTLYATRVSHAVLPNAEVAISSFVRWTNNIARPISETHANGCPKGDEDDLVFRIELEGDLMESPPASAITLSSPSSASGVKFHRTEAADSTLRLNGDHYRTTITVSEFSGCGEDSVEVRINDWVVGHARFKVKSPDTDRSGSVSLTDFANFAAHYPSTLCDCIYPKDYSHCVDFSLPDTVLNVTDFAKYAGHVNHVFDGGGGMPVAASSSGGDVALRFEEFEQDGQRRLRVAVSLENVQAFSAGFVVLLNENPQLSFADWRQNPLYSQTTICAPSKRDGKSEIALGLLGIKNAPMGAIELGTMDLIVASDAPFELADEDLRLVSGEILDLDGNALAVSARGRSVGPRRYDNWLAAELPQSLQSNNDHRFLDHQARAR